MFIFDLLSNLRKSGDSLLVCLCLGREAEAERRNAKGEGGSKT